MRILIGCLSLLFLGACGAGESTDDASVRGDEEAAEEVVQEFFGAIEDMDFVALEETVTSDFELVEDTLVLDFEGFIEFLRPFADAGAIMEYEFSDFNTETRGPVAWTRYRNSAVATMEGQRSTWIGWRAL